MRITDGKVGTSTYLYKIGVSNLYKVGVSNLQENVVDDEQ